MENNQLAAPRPEPNHGAIESDQSSICVKLYVYVWVRVYRWEGVPLFRTQRIHLKQQEKWLFVISTIHIGQTANYILSGFSRGPRQQPLGGGSGGDGVPGYGSTNQAFEPGPGGPNAQGSSSSATSAPELFAASDDKAVGNSTFLGGGGDAGEDDISQSSADTEMADQSGNGRSAS